MAALAFSCAAMGCVTGHPKSWRRLRAASRFDPTRYYFRTAMRFETADASLDWLNRTIAIARGAREKNAVRLDVHEVL